jgi:hypothetical protein
LKSTGVLHPRASLVMWLTCSPCEKLKARGLRYVANADGLEKG